MCYDNINLDLVYLPFEGEKPSEYADRLGLLYSSSVTDEHKKKYGQFFTPIEIATFMASFCEIKKEKVRILDPGCGIGILSTALIERLLSISNKLITIELVVFETDINLLPLAERCFDYLRTWLSARSIDLKLFLCKNDFILHNSAVYGEISSTIEDYDIIISNPPYFKLASNDERAIVAKSFSLGQTNIYAIFTLIATKLLNSEGILVFITPRSFCSGGYYKLFREIFFSTVYLEEIHIFNSRKSAFKRDNVLQENIIFKASKISNSRLKEFNTEDIIISSSVGIKDLSKRLIKMYKISDLVNFDSNQKILHLPLSVTDEKVINIFKTWTGSLRLYNLEISTGPVVGFRCMDIIGSKKYRNYVPLIWLHNVDSMRIIWPLKNLKRGKPKGQYIANNEKSFSRLVENRNYVLVRRFSTKDDTRRLVAAPYFKSCNNNFDVIGIENHLNYIYSKKGQLTIEQSVGIAALLNSRLFDLYFRTFNGNINVSATELREFPLPNFQLIQYLGQKICEVNKSNSIYNIDNLISETFNLSLDLSKDYGQ